MPGITNWVFENTDITFLRKNNFCGLQVKQKLLECFCTNIDDIFKLNLEPKLKQFEVVLKQCQHRKLTLHGKITVIKTFALPKIIYALSSLQNPPKYVKKYIEEQMYTFLWEGKPEKVKRKTLAQNYDKGGLKMIDIDKCMQTQKITLIKRMLDPNNTTVLNEIYIKIKHIWMCSIIRV